MFDQLVLSATTRKRSGRWLYFTGTAAAWMMALTTTIIGGIFAYDARLSSSMKDLVLLAPLPPPLLGTKSSSEPKSNDPAGSYVSAKNPPKELPAPSSKPPDLSRVLDFTGGEHTGGPGGVPDGVPDGVPHGVKYGIPDAIAVAPPPPAAETRKTEPDPPQKTQTIVRKVSTVLQGSATRRVHPVYPILARNARVSGQVVVEVTIDEDGNVIGARALSGHALLKQVSLDAAYGWRWRPTLLNGVPVKVIGTITFNFQL
jgi:protein TonB